MQMIARLCENFVEYISTNSILTEPKLVAFVENQTSSQSSLKPLIFLQGAESSGQLQVTDFSYIL